MYSSNSLHFTRNSQLLEKLAQATQGNQYVDISGKPSKTPVLYDHGGRKYYYMSDGRRIDQLSGTVIETDQNVAQKAKDYASSTAQAASQQQAQKPGVNPAAKFIEVNETRKKFNLPEYRSVQEMIQKEKDLNEDYQAAMQNYIENYGWTADQFYKHYPTVYDFAVDLQKPDLSSGGRKDFSDERILKSILTFNEDELNKIPTQEAFRVLDAFIGRLPNINVKNETFDQYERRLRIDLLKYRMINPKMMEHIIKQKMVDAQQRLGRQNPAIAAAYQERAAQRSYRNR